MSQRREKNGFFEEVGKASATAVWSAWATQSRNGPRVRMVYPTWEGDVLDYDLKDFPRMAPLTRIMWL
jgi:hypothetical protein